LMPRGVGRFPFFVTKSLTHTANVFCFLWINKTRSKDKRYIWVSVCDERLQTKSKEFTRLAYTGLVLELEHLKTETRLISERFANAMGECEN
jgi:hypothetical protein